MRIRSSSTRYIQGIVKTIFPLQKHRKNTLLKVQFECAAKIGHLLAVINEYQNHPLLLRICTLLQCVRHYIIKRLQQRVNHRLLHELIAVPETNVQQGGDTKVPELLLAFSELYTEDSFHLGNQIRVRNDLSGLVILDYRRLNVQFLPISPNTRHPPSQALSEKVSSQYEPSVNGGGTKDRP